MSANISIFVPHVGCPHRCSFCDQNAITGETSIPHKKDVDITVATALKSLGDSAKSAEIAFFGGSFTAIEKEYMLELLSAAYEYVKSGQVRGIRVSTRPDAINEEILSLLSEYGVTSIELGAQSMDDEVLSKNLRGHTAQDVAVASKLIKNMGFELGLQMMTGLYKSDAQKDFDTAKAILNLNPQTVRIYPAITLKNTLLGKLFEDKKYSPPTLPETIKLCSALLEFFESNGIRVIKLGLHSSADVEKNFLAGPYHPAFRELCESEIYLKNALEVLKQDTGNFTLFVNPACISKMTGQKKSNLKKLETMGKNCRVKGQYGLKIYEVKSEKERTSCF